MADTREAEEGLEARIGAQIRAFRKAKGYTQAELAELSGVDNMTISRLENGVRMPTVEHLLKLARVLDVSASRLLGEGERTVSSEALALAQAMDGLDSEQRKFVLDLIILYKQRHAQ
ncbi:helix-turn-helix domain-containing protein [Duganella sp. PWIR1]